MSDFPEPLPSADLPARRRGLLPKLARLALMARWPLLRRRYRRLTIERIDGVPLVILPDVFNAVLFRGGALLARTLAGNPTLAGPGLRVLDMGCGSGVVSVFAARRGANVTAVDINPAAVCCTRINALLNDVAERVDVRQGDLFQPVQGEYFDLVVFNPPFYRGRPRDDLDAAWRGEHVFERFVAGLGERLSPGGKAWLLLSSDGDCAELLALLGAANYTITAIARKEWVEEVMVIYEVRPAAH